MRLHNVSLGEGQEQKARELLTSSMSKGEWIVLQNCHLAPRLLPPLESLFISNVSSMVVHPNFRLWWTAFEHASLSASLLHMSIKLSLETPTSLKTTIQSIWNLPPFCLKTFFTECHYPLELQRLAIALSFYHAVLIERAQLMNSTGSTWSCHFSDSDIQMIIHEIRHLLDNISTCDELESIFISVRSLIVNVVYGARLHSDYERQVLEALLDRFISGDLFTSDCLILGQDEHNNEQPLLKIPLPQTFDANIANLIIQHIPAECSAALLYLDEGVLSEHGYQCWRQFVNNLLRVYPHGMSFSTNATVNGAFHKYHLLKSK